MLIILIVLFGDGVGWFLSIDVISVIGDVISVISVIVIVIRWTTIIIVIIMINSAIVNYCCRISIIDRTDGIAIIINSGGVIISR